MSEPFFIIADGQPVAGTGTPVTVYGLFQGTPDLPELIVYSRSDRQPSGPMLDTVRGETYPLEFHSEDPGPGWRLARLMQLNHMTVRPRPATLARHIRSLGIRKAVLFGPGSDLLLYAVRLLRRLPEVEATLYVLDDPRTALQGSRNPVYRALASRALKELLGRCSRRLAITEELAASLGAGIGAPFEVLPIPVRDDCYMTFAHGATAATPPTPPSLSVFLCGSLGPTVEDSLRCLAQAFQRLSDDMGLAPALVVSGRTPAEDLHRLGFSPDQVHALGWLPSREDVLRSAGKATCTFVPYSFDARQRHFYETSFPGRLADYWLAGPPILVHAPESSAVARYFRRHDLELVCDRLEPNAVAEALGRIGAMSAGERRQHHRRYLDLVARDHLAGQARARLLGAAGARERS